jgi:hypothetical protein
MLRRSILPRLTTSARIAKAPIAKAPIAVAPTAKAPRALLSLRLVRGLPLDYDELERWPCVGYEPGMRSRKGER